MARYRARPFDNCGQKIDKSVQSSPRTECRLDSGLARENRLKPAICLTLWRIIRHQHRRISDPSSDATACVYV